MLVIYLLAILPHFAVGKIQSIDITDRPPSNTYERDTGHYIARYMLGQAIRASPNVCSENCDVTPKCMGFNYYTPRARCSMVTHNRETNPMKSRYRENRFSEHYIKLDAVYECPPGSFRHPYKARCYHIVNKPLRWFEAMKECHKKDAQLALIPNRLAKHAIWQQINDRLEGNEMWIGLEFRRQQAYLRRSGQKGFFMWFSNLLRGLPVPNRKFCGAVVKSEGGKFDYKDCMAELPFLCEYRAHSDTELNELCPHDTGLFDGNCYWSTDEELTPQNAADRCADRGGILAAYPSDEAIDFIGTIWDHIVSSHVSNSWIGLRYVNSKWEWSDGDLNLVSRHWVRGEKPQGANEPCALAQRDNNGLLQWVSKKCDETHPFMCMGQSGVIMSQECQVKQCPENADCHEGPLESSCSCKPGYVTLYQQGVMSCSSAAVCMAAGDPHYTIWDGGRVHYQGLCTHLLCGPCSPEQLPPGKPYFEVRVNNIKRDGFKDGVTFTEWAEVHVYDQVVRLGLDSVLLINGELRIPEITINPYDDTRYIQILAKSGNSLFLITDFGLQVDFRNYRATVVAPIEYNSNMCGICGNFNGNPADDKQHNQNQWQITTQEELDKGQCETIDPYSEPHCETDLREYAEEKCSIIHSMTLLDECRRAEGIELSPFYDDCIEDSCAGVQDTVDSTLCTVLEAITAFCNEAGYPIAVVYRDEANCPMECQENSSYQPDMSLNVATCQNIDALYEISSGNSEGCACDPGFVMDGGKCIPKDQCGCIYGDDDMYLELGMTYVNSDCTISAVCTVGGDVEETPIKCVEHAQCVLSPEGINGCKCIEHYEGNPYNECWHEDSCPYPMPGDITADSLKKTNDLSLTLNTRPAIDPTQHTEIIHITPGGWLWNPRCQIVTCFIGEEWNESPIQCVPHSNCVEGGPNGYQCVCQSGYVGNGTESCEEDSSGTGDPHFMITSHTNGQHICFDFHGKNNEVWQLISDKTMGLTVNGRLFETNNSSPEHLQSFFSDIDVYLEDGTKIAFSRTNITYSNIDPILWGQNVHQKYLHYVAQELYDIRIQDDVVLRVARASGEEIGHYLGIYVVHSDGLSIDSRGILGQFIKKSFNVQNVTWTETLKRGTVVFNDDHPSVSVTLTTRYSRAHGGKIDCWLYHTKLPNDDLLGSKTIYTAEVSPRIQ